MDVYITKGVTGRHDSDTIFSHTGDALV